jgi:hypothetical protein
VLFEPNPNCVEFLKNYPFTPISKNDAVQLQSVAVSDKNGSLKSSRNEDCLPVFSTITIFILSLLLQ